MLETAGEVKTPLQRRLASFGRRLAVVALGICGIVFVAGIAARRRRAPDVHDRCQPRGRSDSRGAASGRADHARARRAQDGGQAGAHPTLAGSGDARLGHVHLLGQDRHADARIGCVLERSFCDGVLVDAPADGRVRGMRSALPSLSAMTRHGIRAAPGVGDPTEVALLIGAHDIGVVKARRGAIVPARSRRFHSTPSASA